MRFKFFILLVAVLSLPFISAASASHLPGLSGESPKAGVAAEVPVRVTESTPAAAAGASVVARAAFSPFQSPAVETVGIYQSDCSTPATDFTLGQTVCAKLTGSPTGSRATQLLRRLAIVGPNGYIRNKVDVPGTNSTATLSFTIPSTATSPVGLDSVDNRGTWQAISVTSSGSPVVKADFVVTDSNVNLKVADLAVASAPAVSEVAPGSNVSFHVRVVNYGPDAAANVQLTAAAPANTSFVSASQNDGPAFNCATSGGTTTCSIASLGRLNKLAATTNFNIAEFTLTYEVSGGAATGSSIVHSSAVTTSTAQRSTRDNSAKAVAYVAQDAPATFCNLTCPSDITVPADTTQNNQAGAFVTFGSAETEGDCGAITADHPSGSFFPVGPTTVEVTSANGGSCSFRVIVTDAGAPTISCPADVDVNITDGCTVSVDTGTPTASSGTTVTGVRSDGRALGSPFLSGPTTITWTATDSSNRKASCTQTVTAEQVSDPNDTTAPVPDVAQLPTVTAACTATVDVPTATDNCSGRISGSTDDPRTYTTPGSHTVHWTYTDAAGNESTQNQTVVVLPDSVAPVPDKANLPTVTGECSVTVTPPTASDNCAGQDVEGTTTDPVTYTKAGTYIVHWSYKDDAGNITTQNQTVVVTDSTAPTLQLNGPASVTVECHTSFTDLGVSVSDNCDPANVTVSVSGSVNVNTPNTYTLTYTGTDSGGNTSAPVSRTVTVVDTIKPVVSLNGSAEMTVECHTSYSELGATASDSCAGGLPASTPDSVNVNAVGDYTLTYSATDPSGNTGTATRVVHVRDTTAPVVTLNGASVVEVYLHGTYSELGATASDSCAGAVTPVSVAGSVNTNAIGSYVLTYSATDPSGNTGTATRTVNVIYKFTGFFSPINNNPTINQVNAGRSVPIKFNLDGNQGLNIFAANSPFTTQVTCGTNAPITDVQETGTAGSSSLSYDAGSGQYNYTWKTESSWAGQCRILNVKLNDGKTYTAYFKFK